MSETLGDRLLGPLLERAAVGIAVLDADARFMYVNARLAEVNGVPVEGHIGRTIHEVIPHISEAVAALHAQVVDMGEPVLEVQIAGSTPGAADRTWQASYLPLEVDGRRVVGVVLNDVTEREQALADARRRVRQHAGVADLGRLALEGAGIDDLLTAACELLARELNTAQAGVLEWAPDRSHLVMRAGVGWPASAIGTVTAEVGRRSQAGFTLLQDGPVLSHDVNAETRFDISEGMRAQGAVSTISTPIPCATGPFGVLGVFSDRPNHFDADDASFVRAVANVIGTAVMRDDQERELERMSGQRGRLVAQALEAGEREQRQVASVLHDDVLQHLLFARQELAEAPDSDVLKRARASVDEAAELLRHVVAGLHPVTLAHAGLTAALESLAAEHRARAGFSTEVAVDAAAEGAHDRLLISLARELLTNVAKHARARHVRLSVTAYDHGIQLTVADDGCGMPDDAFATALARGQIGLATTRERVEALGGTAGILPGLEGRGTGVEIVLPR